MSEIGRPPKLDGEKAREGGRALTVDPLKPEEIRQLKPPTWLRASGRRVWFAALRSLGQARHISHCDLPLLAMTCRAYQRWEKLEALIEARNKASEDADNLDGELDVTPNGFRQMSQLRILADRAAKDYDRLSRQFGMSPVARVRTAGSAQGDFYQLLLGDHPPKKDKPAAPVEIVDPADPYAPAPAVH